MIGLRWDPPGGWKHQNPHICMMWCRPGAGRGKVWNDWKGLRTQVYSEQPRATGQKGREQLTSVRWLTATVYFWIVVFPEICTFWAVLWGGLLLLYTFELVSFWRFVHCKYTLYTVHTTHPEQLTSVRWLILLRSTVSFWIVAQLYVCLTRQLYTVHPCTLHNKFWALPL